jgi:hypothetical protein
MAGSNRKRTPEYVAWLSMRQRCSDPKHRNYPLYGGRGIAVCARWQESFNAFLSDMGEKPSPQHSIDRLDNDCGYGPNNCRWATRREQNANRRNNRLFSVGGVTRTVTDWSRASGVPARTLFNRVGAGVAESRILDPKTTHAVHYIEHDGRRFWCGELMKLSGIGWTSMVRRMGKFRRGLISFDALIGPRHSCR